MQDATSGAVPCKLKRGQGECRFTAKTGDSVTLEILSVKGNVEFIEAEYAGKKLPTPATQITFTVVDGKQPVIVQFLFDDVVNGRGTYQEVCSGHTFIDIVGPADPDREFNICGGATQ